ncbi:MAG: peptidoglycan-binding protein [Minisyncoccota bacterium]
MRAQTITGPYLDANGWTVFTRSPDTRVIYVSSSVGSDTNDGLSQNTPVKTLARGESLLRDGFPDWLLLKKGDTWTNETLGSINVSGQSATEPMLISSYGNGARPLIKTGPSSGGISTIGSGHGDYLAVVGLEFYAYTRDPNSPNFDPSTLSNQVGGFSFLNPTHWLLLEGNKFSFYAGNGIQAYPSGTSQNVSLRRNIITNNYNTTAHSEGIFTFETNNLLIEGNVFDHNGWNTQITGAGSTIFNRNMYLSHGHGTTIVRDNIDADGASGGIQVRTGGTAEDNLFLRDPISIVFGSSQNPVEDVSGVIQNNVTLDSRDIDTQTQGSSIWLASYALSNDGIVSGPSLIKNLDVSGNIIAHNERGTGNIAAIRMEGDGPYSNTSIHDNIVYDWTNPAWPSLTDHRADGFSIAIATSSTGTSFYNNIVQQPVSGFLGWTSNCNSNATGISLRSNTYWSAEIDPPTVWSKGWFETSCGNAVSWDTWMVQTGETGAIKQLVTFPDPNRTIETYMTSLGMTPTYDAFIQRALAQTIDNWDSRFTAATVNNYIRAGFGIGSVVSIPTPDTTPPTIPTNLSGTTISSSQINLSWNASTDNVGVTGYKIYRNGAQIAVTVGTSYSDAGLSASTAYAYTVSAYDAAGNTSVQSSSISIATPALSQPPVITPIPAPVTCASFVYSAWSVCGSSGTQMRVITSVSPQGCVGGAPTLSQACTYTPPIVATSSESSPATPATPSSISPSGLTSAQIQAILSLLSSFGADSATVARINAILMGTTTPANSSSASTLPTTTQGSLSFGARGAQVLRAQQLLTALGFFPFSATGYYGALTVRAVKQFQSTYGIASWGTPTTTGYGAVGPRTWAKLYALQAAKVQAFGGG